MTDADGVEMQTTQPFLLPDGWVGVFSEDGRIYYQNNITKQTQWEPPIQVVTTTNMVVVVDDNDQIKNKDRSEWRAVQTTDGKVYWQNDTTKQTQWNPPKLSQKSSKTSISNGDQNEDIIRRKLWDKEHIIWIFRFLLTIYDFITDMQLMQVVDAWFGLGSLCPEFRCNVADFVVTSAGFLLICSVIGFITALFIKYLDAKTLFVLYKFPMPSQDVLNHELVYLKKFMFWGWMPLIVEDAASITFTCMVWVGTAENVIGLSQRYLISVVVSTLSIGVSIFLSCRKNKKLRQNKAFRCARCCYCCWSSCACCWVFCFVMLALSIGMTKPVPFIDVSNNADLTCEMWEEMNYRPLPAELTDAPYMIYNNSEFNYESDWYGIHWYDNWTFTCLQDARDMILNCRIQWNYLDQTDLCEFDIESGFCGDLTIQCENGFTFYDGNPKMYACIDYCYLD